MERLGDNMLFSFFITFYTSNIESYLVLSGKKKTENKQNIFLIRKFVIIPQADFKQMQLSAFQNLACYHHAVSIET